ncbi:hypothetical protein CLAFUW4_20030 [Fulvia fulva]|nr:hypothetical protein CLAFUR4_20030 [Fulvia fulva]WPV14000.1 hypothetical protein CLAFUW4_20030 [Fulvia fulva]WPV28527.1 hypothetical protein CLAFUW7_20030 [Fulvia fulva]
MISHQWSAVLVECTALMSVVQHVSGQMSPGRTARRLSEAMKPRSCLPTRWSTLQHLMSLPRKDGIPSCLLCREPL